MRPADKPQEVVWSAQTEELPSRVISPQDESCTASLYGDLWEFDEHELAETVPGATALGWQALATAGAEGPALRLRP